MLILLLALTACRPAPPPPPEERSAWGEVVTLGESVLLDAPTIYPRHDRIDAAWIDAASTRYVMRSLFPYGLTHAAQSPVGAVFPQGQHLAPAALNHNHLLWHDADPDQIDAGRHLWAAVLRPDGLPDRAPYHLADAPVYHYDAASSGDNGLWVVWSTGLPAEPQLKAVFIDRGGRRRPVIDLGASGDWPALVRTPQNEMALLWLAEGRVYAGFLDSDGLRQSVPLTDSVELGRGDLLLSFDFSFGFSMDTDHVYLIWNVLRQSGQVETWLAVDDGVPQRLGIRVDNTTPFTTGYNGGAARRASALTDAATDVMDEPNSAWVAWAAPVPDAPGVLAAQVGQSLGVLYLRDGTVVGFQPVVTLDPPGLLGLPALRTDVNRHLTLAWSQPVPDGIAQLKLTTTR